jgi:hypothetical protein
MEVGTSTCSVGRQVISYLFLCTRLLMSTLVVSLLCNFAQMDLRNATESKQKVILKSFQKFTLIASIHSPSANLASSLDHYSLDIIIPTHFCPG